MKTIYQAAMGGIGVLILGAALVPNARADGNEDVVFTGEGLSTEFATAILADKIPIGQTFIPNANNLVGLDLKFQTGQSVGERVVTVEIREGGILGLVVGQTTDTFFVPGSGPFIHHFDFDPSVPLTPGLTYAIQIPLVDISLAGSSSVDPMNPLLYPDGAFFQGGFDGPEPGGATFIPTGDLIFTTYASQLLGCRTAEKQNVSLTTKRGKFKWSWKKGAATTKADFGDPTTTTDYHVCLFDSVSGTPIDLCIDVPAGTGWKEQKKGFSFKSKLGVEGISGIKLGAGDAGKSKIAVKGKEVALPTLPLAQDPEVVVQLSNSNGHCWQSTFTTARKNDAAKFTAKQP